MSYFCCDQFFVILIFIISRKYPNHIANIICPSLADFIDRPIFHFRPQSQKIDALSGVSRSGGDDDHGMKIIQSEMQQLERYRRRNTVFRKEATTPYY